MAVLFPIFLVLLLFWLQRNFSSNVRIKYLVFIAIKIVVSLSVAFYYINSADGGDTLMHFQQVEILASNNISTVIDAMFRNTWPKGMMIENQRSLIFALLLLPFYIFCAGNFWSLTISLILISCILLIEMSSKIWKEDAKLACFLEPFFFLLPGLLIWTGGIFKESFAYIALVYCSGAFYFFLRKGRIDAVNLFLGIIAFTILFTIRYFIAAAFLLTVLLFISYFFFYSKKVTALLIVMLGVSGAIVLILIHPVLNPLELPIYLNMSYQNYIINENFNYLLYLPPTNWYSILIDSPKAFLMSLLAPFPFQWITPSRVLYAFEIYFLLALLIFFRNGQLWKMSSLYFTLCILIVFLFFGLSNPNFGTLFRYKAILIPFLYGLMLKENSLFRKQITLFYNRFQIANQPLKP